MLRRTFTEAEIYPPEFGGVGIYGTPLAGTTLLHLCVDFVEPEMLSWLLDRGADANAKAAVDADGFGGHTPLFGCVLRKDGHDYRDVTPLAWGERFQQQDWVNRAAMHLISERGGRR